jgi:hypothetical protein
MPGLIAEDKGKNVEAVSATSTPTVEASKQSHTSAHIASQLPDRPRSEATIDDPTSTSVSEAHPPTTHPQSASISPYTSLPVTLLVGGPASPSRESEPVPFYVHADLLKSISPFFRAAFGPSSSPASNGIYNSIGFKESQTRTMTLPEERPDDVRYLLQWVYWKAAMFTVCAAKSSSTPASASSCLLTRTEGAGALWHTLIDEPLHALTKYNAERAVVAKAAKHGDISQLIVPRPTPPAFGPLVRLWLLAERLDIRGGLRDEVVERVLELSVVGNCVPGREDVWVLWEEMGGVSIAGGKGRGKLRELVLDLYVGMRCWGLFQEESDPGGGQWHEGFLQELVRRLMWKVHGDWKGGREKEVDENYDADEEFGGESRDIGKGGEQDEEFVMVGRLRRRRCDYHEHS